MAQFRIIYKSTEDNKKRTVYMSADYSSEAIDNVMDDCYDVGEIISCKQLTSE